MATQRLNPINIDYQTPTDVAGFAGQRAAVSEAEAISQNQSRKISEAQSVVSQHLKAQETFARIGQTQQQLQLETAKQVHNQRMQNEELNMMKRKLPFELAQMDADLEAQRIDNAYADEDNASRLRGQHLQNRMAEEDLDRYKRSQQEVGQAGNWRNNAQGQLNSGVDPDDIDWSFASPQTREGREALAKVKEEIRATTRAQRNDADSAAGEAALGTLSETTIENIKKNVPNSFDRNGVLTDVGRAAAQRFSSTRRMSNRDRVEMEDDLKTSLTPILPPAPSGITGRLRAAAGGFTRIGKHPTYKWAEYIDGQFVLTEEGVREMAARKKMRELSYVAVKRVVTTEGGVEKEVIEYEPKNKLVNDSWEDKKTEWRKANPMMSLPTAIGGKLYDDARMEQGQRITRNEDGSFNFSRQQREQAITHGTDLYYIDDNGLPVFESPGQVTGTPTTGGAGGTGGAGAGDSLGSQVITDWGKVTAMRVPFSFTRNVEYKDVDTTISAGEWGKTVAANVGTHYTNLTEKYGWSDEDAREFLYEMMAFDSKGGEDIDGVDTFLGGTKASNNTDELVEKQISILSASLNDPSELFWDEIEGHGTRESDEITWAEMADDPKWVALMAKPSGDWHGETVTFKWQEEYWGDLMIPNTRGHHRLRLKGSKQKTFEHTFDDDEEKLEKMKLQLEGIFAKARKLKKLNAMSRRGKAAGSRGGVPS